jgi:hypothetical protein
VKKRKKEKKFKKIVADRETVYSIEYRVYSEEKTKKEIKLVVSYSFLVWKIE